MFHGTLGIRLTVHHPDRIELGPDQNACKLNAELDTRPTFLPLPVRSVANPPLAIPKAPYGEMAEP